MSKNSKKPARHYADWEVLPSYQSSAPFDVIPGARMNRDEHGGYQFTDRSGVVTDYPPGKVLRVRRLDPDPAPDLSSAVAATLARPLIRDRVPVPDATAGSL